MTLEEMKQIKETRGYSNAMLSAYSGVPLATVARIFSGETRHPRKAALQALETVLTADESLVQGKSAIYRSQAEEAVPGLYSRPEPGRLTAVEEPHSAYGAGSGSSAAAGPREYTAEDYYALPEDDRKELIDGQFYDLNTPDIPHQLIAGYIHASLLSQIEARKGDCVPFISPISVQLDADDRTVVQPDVLIVCKKDIIRRKCIFGAPDFVLEVLSPSTRRRDLTLKVSKYMNAGVREYWLIDPAKKQLLVYPFEEDPFPVLVPLEGRFGLMIYRGEVTVDLDRLREMIDQYSSED